MEKEEIRRLFQVMASVCHGDAVDRRFGAKRLLEREQSRVIDHEPSRMPRPRMAPALILGQMVERLKFLPEGRTIGLGWTELADCLASHDEPTRFDDPIVFDQLVRDMLALEVGLYRTDGIRPDRPRILGHPEDRPVIGTISTPGPNAFCMLDDTARIPIVAFEAGLYQLIEFIARSFVGVPPLLTADPRSDLDASGWLKEGRNLRSKEVDIAGQFFATGVKDALSGGLSRLPQEIGLPTDDVVLSRYARSMRCFVVAHELSHAALGHLKPGCQRPNRATDEAAADDLALFSTMWALAYAADPVPPRVVVGAVSMFFAGLELFARGTVRLQWGVDLTAVQDSHPNPLDRLSRLAHTMLSTGPEDVVVWPGFSMSRVEKMDLTGEELVEHGVTERIMAVAHAQMALGVVDAVSEIARDHLPPMSVSPDLSRIHWFAPAPDHTAQVQSFSDVINEFGKAVMAYADQSEAVRSARSQLWTRIVARVRRWCTRHWS